MSDITFTEIPGTMLKVGTDIVQTSGRSQIGQAPGLYVNDALASSLAVSHPRLVATSSNNRAFRFATEDGLVPVELAGAAGTGAVNDRPAILAAHTYATAIAAKGVAFQSRQYRIDPVPVGEVNYGQGPQPCYVVPPDAGVVDGRGAIFNATSGRGMVSGWWYAGPVTDLAVAASIAAGATSVQLVTGATSTLSVGETVMWRLGDVPLDPAETFNWGFARITAIAGDTVMLDRPIPEAFTLGSPPPQNMHLRKAAVVRDLHLRDMTFETVNAETGPSVWGGERISFERIGSRNLAATTVSCHYVDGATVLDCWADGFNPLYASSGAAFGFAECRNVTMIRPRARGTLNLVRAEAGAIVSISGALFENTALNAVGNPYGTQVKIFQATGRSKISAHDTTISGYGGYVLSETTNGLAESDGHVTFSGRTRLVHPTDPVAIPLPYMSGILDMTIGGNREIYNLDQLRLYRRRFNLRDGSYRSVLGPMGLIVRARVYASPGILIGHGQQLTSLSIGRDGNNGANLVTGSYGGIAAGIDRQLRMFGGSNAGILWTNRLLPVQINCTTSTLGGLDAANEFVEIELWIAEPDSTDRPVSEADWRGEGSEREVLEVRFPSYDLPSIAPGATLSLDFPVSKMQAGDFVDTLRIATGSSGLSVRSADALAGAARVVFENQTGAAIDKGPAEIAITWSRTALGT